MFCGAWAETLVGRFPHMPLSGLEDLNRWMEEFWEDFSVRTKKSAAQDAGKRVNRPKDRMPPWPRAGCASGTRGVHELVGLRR